MAVGSDLSLPAYSRIVQKGGVLSWSIVEQAVRLRTSSDEETRRAGETIVVTYVLGSVVSAVRRVVRRYPTLVVDQNELIQYGITMGWNRIVRQKESELERGIRQRIHSATYRQGKYMMCHKLGIPTAVARRRIFPVISPFETAETFIEEKLLNQIKAQENIAAATDPDEAALRAELWQKVKAIVGALPRKSKLRIQKLFPSDDKHDIKSEDELAKEDGLTVSSIHSWEVGTLRKIRYAIELANLLAETKEAILFGDGQAALSFLRQFRERSRKFQINRSDLSPLIMAALFYGRSQDSRAKPASIADVLVALDSEARKLGETEE